MSELKTSRPFQERFLDGYDRSQLRQEVQKVKPKRSLRQKYATWALGGALALGGVGIPMKFGNLLQSAESSAKKQPPNAAQEGRPPQVGQIANDLRAAKQIADQVAGGVQGAVTTVAQTAAKAPEKIAETVVETPQRVADVAEQVKENFFKKEIPFGSIIYSEARKNDLPPELVAAVAHTESKFVPTARSGAGAVGLMQLVPRTGRWLGASNLTDPTQNIMAGAKYLRYLTDRFGGDQQKAIAAYNAGEGNVRRFRGVPPFKETRNYVQRVRSFQQDLGDRLQSHTAELQSSGPGL
ncbi:MAG TPA: lytic transglycosylase domain-containing protein [Thermoanaerobaculia bacterium]|nr:lytic transglycosylase domain-containing protein [Thermoanaerobaculia bacterium]